MTQHERTGRQTRASASGARPTIARRLSAAAIARPRAVLLCVAVITVIAAIGFVRLHVDTDPENMLSASDPVRLRNAEIEETFGGGPTIVAGFLVDQADGTVDSPRRLAAIVELQREIGSLNGVRADATVGPATRADGVETIGELVARIQADPVLGDLVLRDDGSAAAIFVALEDKSVASEVANSIRDLVAAEEDLAAIRLEVAGLPLAEDAFGREMFVQMAIFAPLAGLVIFALLWLFFRRMALVMPAMIVAMVTVVWTMGALIGSGNTLHIMSSMIPIFLMPIAILDSVHVLSEFFDRRATGSDRAALIGSVLDDLRRPLSFTSLTTAAGFLALVLTPIPPVRVFGVFVAIGVLLAWLLTVMLLPALLMVVPDERALGASLSTPRSDVMAPRLRALVTNRRGLVLGGFTLAALVVVPGLSAITVNDNPVRWFRGDHEVRLATEALTEALPGTFQANLLVQADDVGTLQETETRQMIAELVETLEQRPEVGAVASYLDADTPAFRSGDLANVRLLLRSGDNTAMQEVVEAVDRHLVANPTSGLSFEWAGESYLNLRWQEQMVQGMLAGFAVTVAVVLLLLVALFRSLRWALLAIAPVLWTVLMLYGLLGLSGRDLDMPVAVLSTLVLGIAVDFAIHFVARVRSLAEHYGSLPAAVNAFFGEPSRAVTRNAIVVGAGFLPLLLSSLVPYVVVGVLLASIIAASWLASVVALPALTQRADRRGSLLGAASSPSTEHAKLIALEVGQHNPGHVALSHVDT